MTNNVNLEEVQRVLQKFTHVSPTLTATAPQCEPSAFPNCQVALYPHQRAMVRRLCDADEYITVTKATTEVYVKGACGCGKSYAILGWIAVRKLAKARQQQYSGTGKKKTAAVLIIVPGTLVIQWREAITTLGCNLTYKVLETYQDIMSLYVSTAHFTKNDIVLTSIENYPVLRDTLTGLKLSVEIVVVDEVDGVADCQKIDCASMISAPSSSSALQSMNMNPDANNSQHYSPQQLSKVKPIPAMYVVRVSATMDIPPLVRQQHGVTVVECDQAFISTSIKLEEPVVNTVRCRDCYIYPVLRFVMDKTQMNAMHALDYRSALRGFKNINPSTKLEGPIDVICAILESYRSQLSLNENIISSYIESFPYLEDLDPLYGIEFQSLTTINAEGESEIRLAPSMSPQLRELMIDLPSNVSLHILEKFDDTKEDIRNVQRWNQLLRSKMALADLCPGGCKTRLTEHTRLYCSPCCSLEICLACVDQQQRDESLRGRCCICLCPVSMKGYRLLSTAKASTPPSPNPDKEQTKLLEDKKTALIRLIIGRKIELQEARTERLNREREPKKKKARTENTDGTDIDEPVSPIPVPKFVVGSAYSETLIHLESQLNDLEITTAHLEAGSGKKTDTIVRKFWNTEEIDVLFCQLSSTGSSVGRGLNLQIGSDVVFFERPSESMAQQLRGRLQRPGRVSQLQEWHILHENE